MSETTAVRSHLSDKTDNKSQNFKLLEGLNDLDGQILYSGVISHNLSKSLYTPKPRHFFHKALQKMEHSPSSGHVAGTFVEGLCVQRKCCEFAR